MSANELCPHCVCVPMIARTNGWGGVYLECLDCGYYDSVKRRPDPKPAIVVEETYADGRTRKRKRPPRRNREGIRFTRKEGIAAVQRLAKELKRTPKKYELGPHTNTPSERWLRNQFGSLRRGMLAAKLTPTPVGARPTMPNVSRTAA